MRSGAKSGCDSLGKDNVVDHVQFLQLCSRGGWMLDLLVARSFIC